MSIDGLRGQILHPHRQSPKWMGYVVTIIAELLLTYALRAIGSQIQLTRFPFLYILLTMVIAYMYGLGPAIWAVILGLFAFAYYFISPTYTFWPPSHTSEGWARIVIFILGSTMSGIAALAARMYNQRALRLVSDLDESNKRLYSTLESITDGFFTLDKDWRLTYLNHEAERLFQEKREELIGKNLWDGYPEAIGQGLYQELHRAFEKQISIEVRDYSYLVNRWLEARIYPSSYGLSVYFRDVTDRKTAEDISRRYELLSKHARDIILFMIRDGRIIEANNAASIAYGYEREELLSMNIYDLRAPESRPEVNAQMDEASVEGVLFETLHCRRDGSTFPVEVSSLGTTIGDECVLLSIIRDITERKLAEEEIARARETAELAAVREAQARATLQATIDTTPVGIIVAEAKTMNIYYFSPGAVEILGTVPTGNAEGPAPGTYELLHPDGSLFLPEDLPLLRSLKYGESASNIEILVRRQDGSEVTVLVSSVPVRDYLGNITAAVGTMDDITELAKLRRTLEGQVILLQRALAPREVSIGHGYDVAAAYLPAHAGQEIGGDFYDVFKTADGKFGILIGDVAGKGIEVASFAAIARSTVHGFTYETSQPGKALTRANSVLYDQQSEFGSFVTMLLTVLDLPTGNLFCSGAGHPPGFICRADGKVEFTVCGGQPPVALLDNMVFLESHSQINPGDKLILLTDGITEARHGIELFDLEGVQRVLEQHGHKTPKEVTEEIIKAAREWAGGVLTDDAAVLVVEHGII